MILTCGSVSSLSWLGVSSCLDAFLTSATSHRESMTETSNRVSAHSFTTYLREGGRDGKLAGMANCIIAKCCTMTPGLSSQLQG